MQQYAKEHFACEEKLMQESAYAELEEQRKQHTYFSGKISQLADAMSDNCAEGFENLLRFLGTWWTTHILKWDMKYKSCIH